MGMQKMLIRVLALLLLFAVFVFEANATGPRIKQDLFSPNVNTVYALDFPPFVTTDLAYGGLVLELANAVFETEKIDAPIISQPVSGDREPFKVQPARTAAIDCRAVVASEAILLYLPC